MTATDAQGLGQLNFFSPEEMADPGVSIARLYAGERCQRYEHFSPPFYVLSRYEDVNYVLMNPDRFLSGPGQGPGYSEPAGIVSDAPMHTFFRELVQDDFKPGSIKALQPRLEAIADELLDAVEGKEEWDLHDDFAFPLPVIIICEIFGIPTDDIAQFRMWSDIAVSLLSADDEQALQDGSFYRAEMQRMQEYILNLVREKRDDLEDNSLMARIARAQHGGATISEKDAVAIVTQLFVAGNETTTSLITNFMMRMLGDGYQWADFCSGKIDLTKAINESLRYDPPLLAMFRTTAQDEEVAGVKIPANSKVMIHYGAANRDPEVFEDPHVFDVHRPVRRMLSFALGVHFCVGAELAKLEAKVMLEALRKRHPRLQPSGDSKRMGPFLFWGRSKLPVTDGTK